MKGTQFALYPGAVWCSDPLPGLREVTRAHALTHTHTVHTQMRALSVEDVDVFGSLFLRLLPPWKGEEPALLTCLPF